MAAADNQGKEDEFQSDLLEIAETFDKMNLKENLLKGIYSYGFEKPSFIQQKGILPVISGRDAIVQAQSGTGKTATFCIGVLQQIDLALRAPQGLLLSPTRELATQTHTVLTNLGSYLGVTSHVFIGGTRVADDTAALRAGVQVIVGTPGRIMSLIEQRAMELENLKVLVLDEADELLAKGFLEDMQRLISKVPGRTQLALFSATLPQEIMALTKKFMNDPIRILVKTEAITLEGIQQFFVEVSRQDKYLTLCDLFDTLSLQQTIVYCNLRRTVEELADRMGKDNHVVSCIHSDLDPSQRSEVMRTFRMGKSRVLISTDLTARGIDVQTVSLVINYDIPRDLAFYMHRIGRSGRFGRKGSAINLVAPEEEQDFNHIKEHYKIHVEPLPGDLSKVAV